MTTPAEGGGKPALPGADRGQAWLTDAHSSRGRRATAPDGCSLTAEEQNRERVLGLVPVSRFRRDLYAAPFGLGRQPITSRTEVLNCLVWLFGLRHYLELGVAGGENFAAAIAPVRQSVDPRTARRGSRGGDDAVTCPAADSLVMFRRSAR